MKVRTFVLLLAAFIPAYLVLSPTKTQIPDDLRDAVADSALGALGGSEVSVPDAPAPEPVPPGHSAAKSIYGDDDRLDYYESSAAMRKLSDSVVSLWKAEQVQSDGRTARLATMNFGAAAKLCPGEKFREQPIGAFCSGSLVGEDIVMTAGHCVLDEAACAETRFVFGYNVGAEGAAATTQVPAGDVYACKSIIKRDLDTKEPGMLASVFNGGPGPDFAVIKLDRKVAGRAPLAVNRRSKPAAGDQQFVIGHPVGLPLKVAGNAKVRDASPKYFYKTDLDTFGGNSGSAVFSARTNLIEGILVRGDVDFVKSPAGCTVAAQVPQDGGRGEAVTKISVVEKYIP